MTLPLDPSGAVGESEMSWGPGLFPNKNSNFGKNGSGRGSSAIPFPETEPIDDNFQKAVAARRTDSTVGDETDEQMMIAEGNPDRFGAQPPLVQTPVNQSPSEYPEKVFKDRVTRER